MLSRSTRVQSSHSLSRSPSSFSCAMSSLSVQCGPRTLHRQHAAAPLTGVKAASTRPRCVRVRSMAQPVYETANIVQAALPVVLKMLPGAVTAGVALYAGANWLSYSRLRREVRRGPAWVLSEQHVFADAALTWPLCCRWRPGSARRPRVRRRARTSWSGSAWARPRRRRDSPLPVRKARSEASEGAAQQSA